MADRVILHCDMNNFYASVEGLLNPALKEAPMAVCGDEKKRHGVVVAKNYKARAFDVQTGDTANEARAKCPGLVLVQPHHEAYREISQKAKDIYARYTPFYESMGLDECWLDVTELCPPRTGREIADELRETVKRELNLTISVGVSFTKGFAKLGSDMKKPDAVTEIPRERMEELVWPLPVESLIGVGNATLRQLHLLGIHTVGDLAKTPCELLKRRMGKHGETLWQRASGLEDTPVQDSRCLPLPKSVSHGTTTAEDMNREEEVQKTISSLTAEIEKKLSRYGLVATGVALLVRDREFAQEQHQMPLSVPTRDAVLLAQAAFALFKDSYRWEHPVRMVTVTAINLQAEDEPYQMSLF